MSSIQTAKVAGRRTLRFNSVDDVIADVDKIMAANANGQLQVIGNWTAGQILAHLAAWTEYPYKGYPMKAPPWIVRFIMKRMLKGTLKNGMRPGLKIPGIAGGTTGQDDQPIELAAVRYKSGLNRLQSGEAVVHSSPAFGELDHPDIIQLQLRHAELHLSFIKY